MTRKSQYTEALTALIALTLFVTGCTGKRTASLPDDAQDVVFAISDFGDLQTDKTTYNIKTDDSVETLSLADSSKASAENGLVTVTKAQVPARLQFMFKGLDINGQPSATYPIVFSVDKQFVTVYKIVTDSSQLSHLEKQLAQAKDEVVLQKQLQKTKDNIKTKAIMANLQKARAQKQSLLSQNNGTLLIPLFKYKVAGYGVLQRTKNELREDTSTLRLRVTDWTDATHIQLSITSADRLPVGVDANTRGDLDRTYVMDKINNKIMTADTLSSEYKIPVNLQKDTRVLTLLDVDALHVYEVGQVGKTVLTDSQLQQLQNSAVNSNVKQCSADIVKALPADAQKNCVLVLRYDIPVTYVRPELPTVDYDGNQANILTFKPVRAADSVGLVQIAENVEPKKIEANTDMDPRTTIRVADIKDKEFFFRRTLEDAPLTTPLEPGSAGALTIVKFELQESRIVVRKADKLVAYKTGTNAQEIEELMSIPVQYFKRDLKDAAGAQYATGRVVPASRQDAEYVELDWTKNTLPTDQSPYAAISDGCFKGIADQQVTDLDMRIDKGILNFSFQYSVGLQPTPACTGLYNMADDYNGTPSYQLNARMKERISFRVNDHTTDETFVGQVPFRAQNSMGYGVWTLAEMNPTDAGLFGREGTEITKNVVQDFRNGRVVMYTVTNLPSDDPEMRELYVDVIHDVVNSWDAAYHQVFKGSDKYREGRYIDVQIAGENGVSAHVGDLDKNIIHFENKTNDNSSGLGVSQVGYNPRSGIVVADSLIIYAGNLKAFVARYQRNIGIANQWNDQKKEFKKEALAQLVEQQKQDDAAGAKAAKPDATAADKANAAVASSAKMTKAVTSATHVTRPGKLTATNYANFSRSARALYNLRKNSNSVKSTNLAPLNAEYAWIEKIMRQVKENGADIETMNLDGVIAQEMLTSLGGKLNPSQRASLQKTISVSNFRNKQVAQFKNTPGCMIMERDAMGHLFAEQPFKEAMRNMLHFDLAHEMGHSQGLTHNFIGSFDKANFVNEDGSASERNYSSIMDYFEPGTFAWGGIGTYDIHALRASHLGLLEVSPEFKKYAEGAYQDYAAKNNLPKTILERGNFIQISTIQKLVAPNGWSTFAKDGAKLEKIAILKPFKYCTDINVGYEPSCQRFDYGTSAKEVVQNMVLDQESSYINNYHSWDRLKFGLQEKIGVIHSSIRTMFQMRQFLDEAAYRGMFKVGSDTDANDYLQGAVQVYIYYMQLLQTPDLGPKFENRNMLFENGDRFVALPYQYKDDKDQVQTDVEIYERRSIRDIYITDDRIDTIGLEIDKIQVLDFLTWPSFPAQKYADTNMVFSFLDLEKTVFGMTAETSMFGSTVQGMMTNNFQMSFTNEHTQLNTIPNEKGTVTAALRSYAPLHAIVDLDLTSLTLGDNYANRFKVGSSVGKAPGDRISVAPTDAVANSTQAVSYWAVDAGSTSQAIVKLAASKGFYIKHNTELQTPLEKLSVAVAQNVFTQGQNQAAVDAASKDLVGVINGLNKNGEILSADDLKQNPAMTVTSLVAALADYAKQATTLAVSSVTQPDKTKDDVKRFSDQSDTLVDQFPLIAVEQKALKKTLTDIGTTLAAQKGGESMKALGDKAGEMLDGSQLEVSYGIMMMNLNFMNGLTNKTNPEFNR